MYVFHDHIIPRATQLIVKKHDFADKRRVLSETLAFSKNPFSNTGFLWDEHRLSTGKIRVSQEIYFVYEKTLFLIQNHEQDDVSIKHLQTDVFKFP